MKVSMSLNMLKKEKAELFAIAKEKGMTGTQAAREALQLYFKVHRKTNPCPVCGATIKRRE